MKGIDFLKGMTALVKSLSESSLSSKIGTDDVSTPAGVRIPFAGLFRYLFQKNPCEISEICVTKN